MEKQYALVTGACSGIGLQYAHELARLGYSLIVVSNREKEITETALLLSETYSVKAVPLYTDLTQENSPQAIYDFCQAHNYVIEILINNAGMFSFKQLISGNDALANKMINLHITCVTNLCILFGRDMCARKSGYILNMSSLSAWMSLPGITIYESTKAYICTFSKSFRHEIREYNVKITVVCPGAVDTGLYGLAPQYRRLGVKIGVLTPTPKLARKALKAMFNGKSQYIPGMINRLFIPILKLFPDFFITYIKHKLSRYEK